MTPFEQAGGCTDLKFWSPYQKDCWPRILPSSPALAKTCTFTHAVRAMPSASSSNVQPPPPPPEPHGLRLQHWLPRRWLPPAAALPPPAAAAAAATAAAAELLRPHPFSRQPLARSPSCST
eukprot:SAG22_NODE_243_length_14055_cov_3.073015_6_plen_121_part_00